MRTCEQVPRDQTRLFDEILYGWYLKRKLARRYYSRAWQGEQTRHKFRIKRWKKVNRLDIHIFFASIDYAYQPQEIIDLLKKSKKFSNFSVKMLKKTKPFKFG